MKLKSHVVFAFTLNCIPYISKKKKNERNLGDEFGRQKKKITEKYINRQNILHIPFSQNPTTLIISFCQLPCHRDDLLQKQHSFHDLYNVKNIGYTLEGFFPDFVVHVIFHAQKFAPNFMGYNNLILIIAPL